MGVEIIQEFKKAGANIQGTDLAGLIIGPCKQVVDEYMVTASIPFDQETFNDFSGFTNNEKVGVFNLNGAVSFIHTRFYDKTDSQAKTERNSVKQYFKDENATVTSGIMQQVLIHGVHPEDLEDRNIIVYSGSTSSGYTEYVIIAPSDISTSPVYNSSEDGTLVTTTKDLSSLSSPATAIVTDLFDESITPMFVAMTNGQHQFTEFLVFADVPYFTQAGLEIDVEYQGFPMVINYPNLKPGAIVETDTVGFTYKDATALVLKNIFTPSVPGVTTFTATSGFFGSTFVRVPATTFTSELAQNELKGYKIDVVDTTQSPAVVLETHKIISNSAKIEDSTNGDYYLLYIDGRWGRDISVTGLELHLEWRIDIGDEDVTFWGVYLGDVMQGDVLKTSKGQYKIAGIEDYTLKLATTVYSDESVPAEGFAFEITRFYDKIEASNDATLKDWDAGNDYVILYAAEDNYNNPIISGQIYISYTAFRTDLGSIPFKVEDIDALKDMMDVDLRNPLGKALEIALANSNTPMYGCAITSNDYDGFAEAIENTEGTDEFYSIVCLSTDPAVLSTLEQNVDNQSAPEESNLRIGLVTTTLPTTKEVSEGSGNLIL